MSIVSRLDRLGSPSWPVVFLALCCWNGLLAVFLGKEMNWDLLNYHFYNGYAFLTGRMDLDLAPAQAQTFVNPLLDVPLYLAIVGLPPVVVGAAYGFAQGLNGGAVWLIARKMLPIDGVAARGWAAFGLALLSGLGAINISELGGSMGDTLVSVPVLFSVALLLRKQAYLETAPSTVMMGWAGLAGAISGIGAGLKITSALYSVGFAFGCLFLVRALNRRLFVTVAFVAGVVGTWLLLNGFWLWQMWSRFGDPLFPFFRLFNDQFRPEFAGVIAAPDTRFRPASGISAALYPLVWAINPRAVTEAPFWDWRFPVLYLLIAVLAIQWCARRWSQARPTRQLPAGARAFLLVGGLASYALWLFKFAIYRYLAPLEWLVPLAITLALWALLPPRYRAVTIVTVLMLTAVTTKPMNWGRGGWTRSYFGVVAPRLERGTSSMVLIAGLNGLSFVVPHFPADVRFIRLQSNSFLYGMALGGAYGQGRSPNQLDKLVKQAIASHQGKLYVMLDGFNASPADRRELAGAYDLHAVLGRLGLRLRAESCQHVRMLDTPPPPWAAFRRSYVQPALMPAVTLCSLMPRPFDSPEFQGVAAPIAQLYAAYFTRIPDPAGLQHWITRHKAGMSLAAISDAFANSPEFQATYGSLTDAQFVTLVYRNVLGRDPDPDGFAYWVGQLSSRRLPRSQVMLGFSESPEYRQTWSTAEGGE